MRTEERGYTIEELSSQAGVPVRTVRYYITEGLLPGPGSRGKNAAYGEEHLLRLLLTRRLAEQHLPLGEIRRQLAGLSFDEIRSLLKTESRRLAEQKRSEKADSPRDYVSALLRRARAHRVAEEPPDFQDYQEPMLFSRTPAGALPAPVEPESPRLRAQSDASAPIPPIGEAWRRIELASGVELQVKEGEYASRRDLIEELIDTARRFEGQGRKG